jgi:hypothetical protein
MPFSVSIEKSNDLCPSRLLDCVENVLELFQCGTTLAFWNNPFVILAHCFSKYDVG